MVGEHPVQAHEEIFRELKSSVKDIDDKLLKGVERIRSLEKDMERAKEDINDKKAEIKAISEVAHSVKYLGETMEKVVSKVELHDEKLNNLEIRPAKTITKYVEEIFVYSLIAVIGYLVAQIV